MNDPFLHIIGSVIDHTILSQVASLFNLLFPGSIFYHQFFKIIQIIGQVNAGDNMRLCPFHLFTSRSPAFFARLSYYLHLTSGFPGMSIIYLYGKAFAYRYTFFRNRLPHFSSWNYFRDYGNAFGIAVDISIKQVNISCRRLK